MPAQRPCAAFEPISPDLNLSELVESTPNFEFVVRIHWSAIEEQGIERFERLVLLHVILGGKPLVIEGYNERLEGWIFAVQWLRDNYAMKGWSNNLMGFVTCILIRSQWKMRGILRQCPICRCLLGII